MKLPSLISLEVEQLIKLEIEVCVEAELDEQWSFVGSKKNQMWLWYALDKKTKILLKLFKGIFGKVFADKGFITKAFEKLLSNGLKLITGIRRNMKNKLMEMEEKLFLKKRGMIESINDLLMTLCDIDHTRHRSPLNAFTHLFAGLAAYSFLNRKPCIINKNFYRVQHP